MATPVSPKIFHGMLEGSADPNAPTATSSFQTSPDTAFRDLDMNSLRPWMLHQPPFFPSRFPAATQLSPGVSPPPAHDHQRSLLSIMAEMSLPPGSSLSDPRTHRQLLATLAGFSPVELQQYYGVSFAEANRQHAFATHWLAANPDSPAQPAATAARADAAAAVQYIAASTFNDPSRWIVGYEYNGESSQATGPADCLTWLAQLRARFPQHRVFCPLQQGMLAYSCLTGQALLHG